MPIVEEIVPKKNSSLILERKNSKPSKIELVVDGMVVRFAYHNPIKIFFNTFYLYQWVNHSDLVFRGDKFHFKKERGNKIKLTLNQPICGHTEMVLPKDVFVTVVKEMFED